MMRRSKADRRAIAAALPKLYEEGKTCFWCKQPIALGTVWNTDTRGMVHKNCETDAVKDGRIVQHFVGKLGSSSGEKP